MHPRDIQWRKLRSFFLNLKMYSRLIAGFKWMSGYLSLGMSRGLENAPKVL